MSYNLDENELRNWEAFRERERTVALKDLFAEPQQDIQLSEIKARLKKISHHGCVCLTCITCLAIIEAIELAQNRSGGGNDVL